jgi:hypothetical protein
MTDPPSGIHRRAKPLKAISIDDLAEAAGVVGGVHRQDIETSRSAAAGSSEKGRAP